MSMTSSTTEYGQFIVKAALEISTPQDANISNMSSIWMKTKSTPTVNLP